MQLTELMVTVPCTRHKMGQFKDALPKIKTNPGEKYTAYRGANSKHANETNN